MDRLRKLRIPLRAAINGAIRDAEDELTKPDLDQESMELVIEVLDRVVLDIVEVDQQILAKMVDDGATEVEIETEGAEIENLKRQAHAVRFKLARRIQPQRSASPTLSGSSVFGGAPHRTYKLPKIEISKYNGELLDWLGWWSQFKKIHNDVTLDSGDKFQYLLQSVKSGTRAKDLVDSYPQSAENYSKVVEALEARFGRKKLLKQVYVRELLKMVINNAKNSEHLDLSRLHDKLESHLRALESLGVTWEQSAEFLFPMVESSLPDDILVAWQRSALYGKDGTEDKKSELDFLMQFIQQEVQSEEQRKLARAGWTSDKTRGQKTPNSTQRPRRQSTGEAYADQHTASALFSGSSNGCVFCSKPHPSHDCIKAQSMSLEDKRIKIKESRVCFLCLRPGHNASKCKAAVRCLVCGKKHLALLCPEIGKKIPDFKSAGEGEVKSEASLASSTCNVDVLLETVIVNLVNGKNQLRVRLLFDNGSQRSSVLHSVASQLNFKVVGRETIRRNLFGGTVTQAKLQEKFQIQLQDQSGKNFHKIIALGEEVICGEIPKIPNGPWMAELREKKIWVADTQANSESQISILIGSDHYQSFMTGKRFKLKCGLVAVETIFGWTLSGPLQYTKDVNLATTVTSMRSTDLSTPELWSLEVLGIKDPAEHQSKVQKDLETQQHFMKTVSRTPDGRYTVQLPWVSELQDIPDNRSVAEKRLQSTIRKLESQNMVAAYDQVFRSWEAEGIIEEVTNQESNEPVHYIPHRAVIKDSLTTPIRPVFDASCKTGRNPSLNDLLLKGPNLLELIPDLLLRFREKKLGVIADVRKAFLMVGVSEKDRNHLRFLWQDPETKQVKVFRHCRVVFGVTCSPYLLAAVIEYHIQHLDDSRKPAGEKLLPSLYVDNCVTSVNNYEEYEDFKTVATEIMAEAKMDLRQWEVSGELEPSVSKVLGLNWKKSTDTLSCEVLICTQPEKLTKRTVLSQIQKIFDPLGFLSPALLQAKIILQEAWKGKLGWDEELPKLLAEKYANWVKTVDQLSEIQVPRFMTSIACERMELHTFCDASKHAYAAVVFLRSVCDGASTIRILQSKTRVSPLKLVSIPRLELLACTIGARLTNSTKKALNLDLPTTFWSDSSTALAWIKRNSEWGTFVGNRVREIVTQTNADSWRFVPGIMNPADLPSRGCTPAKLLESKWWEGPEWLKNEEEWPTEEYELDEDAINQERRVSSTKLLNLSKTSWFEPPFSSFLSNVRVIAWVRRFIAKCKKSKQAGELTVMEIEQAEAAIFHLIQQESFDSKANVISTIRVVHGEDGLIRVNSKLLHRQDSENFRLPVLLPNSHKLVHQLIEEEHRQSKHAGIQFMMGKLRERVWILQGRRTIKKVIGACVICKRYTVKKVNVPTAPLPENRIKDAKAFEVTGVDLCGPLYLKDKTKTWIVLFTCAVYRCVHLELVTSLNTDSFLLALFRFISRRGRCSIIYSDNGTNFVGAENLFKELDWTRIIRETRLQKIQWIFNLPSAAWWGGWWERLIQSVKGLLRRVLGHSKLNYVQLETCLCEVEAIINGRPLTYVTEDQDDLIPLTPGMFLQDLRETSYPEAEVLNAVGFREKYHRLQHIRQELRGRFRKEFLGLLVHRGASMKIHQFTVGDVVLIGSDNKKRIDWPLGRINQLVPGRDGETRTAKVKTATGELVRPLQRLYPLEVRADSIIVTQEVKTAAKKEKEKKQMSKPEAEADSSLEPVQEVITRFGRVSKKPDRF